MGKLKNLVVDPEKVNGLVRLRGTSESAAVRQAVDFALAAEEVMTAIRELHARGRVDGVFGRLPDAESGPGTPGKDVGIWLGRSLS